MQNITYVCKDSVCKDSPLDGALTLILTATQATAVLLVLLHRKGSVCCFTFGDKIIWEGSDTTYLVQQAKQLLM